MSEFLDLITEKDSWGDKAGRAWHAATSGAKNFVKDFKGDKSWTPSDAEKKEWLQSNGYRPNADGEFTPEAWDEADAGVKSQRQAHVANPNAGPTDAQKAGWMERHGYQPDPKTGQYPPEAWKRAHAGVTQELNTERNPPPPPAAPAAPAAPPPAAAPQQPPAPSVAGLNPAETNFIRGMLKSELTTFISSTPEQRAAIMQKGSMSPAAPAAPPPAAAPQQPPAPPAGNAAFLQGMADGKKLQADAAAGINRQPNGKVTVDGKYGSGTNVPTGRPAMTRDSMGRPVPLRGWSADQSAVQATKTPEADAAQKARLRQR